MSYFNYHTLSGTLICSVNSPLEYIPPEYTNVRFHYFDEESTEERIKYVYEIQNWLDKPYNDKYTNRQFCSSFYRELLDIIYENDYNIKDINQFKEDIIHYLYTLSDLDNNGNE